MVEWTAVATYRGIMSKTFRRERFSPAQLLQKDVFKKKVQVIQQPPPLTQTVDLKKKAHRRLTDEEKVRIVGLRFGGFFDGNDFTVLHCNIDAIAKATNVPYSTVCRLLRDFKSHGNNIDAILQKKERQFACIP